MMRRFTAALAALGLSLGLTGAEANPILHGGFPGPAVGTLFACDGGGSGVCADHSAGQTFVQWPDSATGASGANFRYRVYRSTSPITSGNYASATLIASYDLNNSGQLIGGNPDSSGSTFTQANRQANNAANPMAKIPDANLGGTKTLSYATGLQVYTALGSATAYYGVVQTDTSNASQVFIGSVGPIAEAAATQKAVRYVHHTTGYGTITYDISGNPTGTAGLPIVFFAHASSGAGGCAAPIGGCGNGDYYQWWGDTTEGWQDGQFKIFDIAKDGISGTNYPSYTGLGGTLVYAPRDTQWNTVGTGANETFWFGVGLTPNPLVGRANRFYPTTMNTIKKQIVWLAGNYSADLNQVHWTGVSMGAFGGAIAGLQMKSPLDPTKPMFASIMVGHPILRWDLAQWAIDWAGVAWGGTVANPWPFSATLHDAVQTLGLDSSAVFFNDDTPFTNYANVTQFLSNTSANIELPFFAWVQSKNDVELASSGVGGFAQEIAAWHAFQAKHRGHAFCWFMGRHDTTFTGRATIDADAGSGVGAIAGVSYKKTKFRLDRGYIAFDTSSIDDNPGNGVLDGNGIYDGDVVGCSNAGFDWTIPTDTIGSLAFTVSSPWMSRSPTVVPVSTSTATTLGPSGTGNLTLASSTGFLSTTNGNSYFRIGNEIVQGTLAGTTLTVSIAGNRGILGTTAADHTGAVGETVTQYPSQAIGPNGGPYATMTVNVTPRWLQNFKPAGAPSCTFTPFGGSPTSATVTDLGNGVFTLIGVTINSGGSTNVSCS